MGKLNGLLWVTSWLIGEFRLEHRSCSSQSDVVSAMPVPPQASVICQGNVFFQSLLRNDSQNSLETTGQNNKYFLRPPEPQMTFDT